MNTLPTTSQRYQQLNPLAFAVAAGCTALIAPFLIGFPMMGIGGMMGGYGGGGMWGYHAASKPSGLVVRGIAGLFTDDLPKE